MNRKPKGEPLKGLDLYLFFQGFFYIRITVIDYIAASCTKFCIYFEKKGIMKALPDQYGI